MVIIRKLRVSHRVDAIARSSARIARSKALNGRKDGQLAIDLWCGRNDAQLDALHHVSSSRDNLTFAYLDLLINAEFGLTDVEAADALSVKQSTICARRGDLRKRYPDQQGFVVDSGERREGDSGKDVTVWVARNDLLVVHRSTSSPDPRIDGTVSGVDA